MIKVVKSQENAQSNHKKLIEYTDFLMKCRRKCRSVLDVIIRYCLRFNTNYMSQETIGTLAGVKSRTDTNEIIQMLEEQGCLIKIYRGVKKTCLYKIPARLLQFARQLKEFLPSLKQVLYNWSFLSFQKDALINKNSQNPTQYISNNIINLQDTETLCVYTHRMMAEQDPNLKILYKNKMNPKKIAQLFDEILTPIQKTLNNPSSLSFSTKELTPPMREHKELNKPINLKDAVPSLMTMLVKGFTKC